MHFAFIPAVRAFSLMPLSFSVPHLGFTLCSSCVSLKTPSSKYISYLHPEIILVLL